ncbi:MAG: DUF4147 domain-containing protein [Melioribacteraceae bacterium]|nr:DUF4147 domain-containing protein [Melioribacteraceae bacterium]
MTSFNKHILEIADAAINSVKPSELIPDSIQLKRNKLIINQKKFNLNEIDKIFVIGAGKASGLMALEVEKILRDKITAGCVSTYAAGELKLGKIELIEAGHPIPNENSLIAGQKIFDLASSAGEDDLVICLLSGGGSALMELLPKNISLDEFQKLTDLLIKSGADINEINTLRKSISLLKGGKLAETISPAACITLIISDVVGDKLESIASGPTTHCDIGLSNSLDILKKYELTNKVPSTLLKLIKHEKTTTKEIDWNKVNNFVIGNNQKALEHAKRKAVELGYSAKIIDSKIEGNVRSVAQLIARYIKESAHIKEPTCLLFGGETTVNVKGSGKGGRNQELVLSTLMELKEIVTRFTFASFGTDGRDGPTDAAGAYIDHKTWEKVTQFNLDPIPYLEKNDSYNFFKKLNQLIVTGSTGTNVMDLQIVLID